MPEDLDLDLKPQESIWEEIIIQEKAVDIVEDLDLLEDIVVDIIHLENIEEAEVEQEVEVEAENKIEKTKKEEILNLEANLSEWIQNNLRNNNNKNGDFKFINNKV